MAKNIEEAEYICTSPIQAYPCKKNRKDGYRIISQDTKVWIPKQYFADHFAKANTYIDRMKLECWDLMGKEVKLSKFLYDKPYLLDDIQYMTMTCQLSIIECYHRILRQTINYIESKKDKT